MIYIILFLLVVLIILSLVVFFIFNKSLLLTEERIVGLFQMKVAKIPAFIEVMRPHVADELAFSTMVWLHTESIIWLYKNVYDLLEQNARIKNQFLFLLKLSVHIPKLQKMSYFLYIRDFIIEYDREMQAELMIFNRIVGQYNLFVNIKNMTIIWLGLPGRKKMQIF